MSRGVPELVLLRHSRDLEVWVWRVGPCTSSAPPLPVLCDTCDRIVQEDPWNLMQFRISTCAHDCLWIQAQQPQVAKCTLNRFGIKCVPSCVDPALFLSFVVVSWYLKILNVISAYHQQFCVALIGYFLLEPPSLDSPRARFVRLSRSDCDRCLHAGSGRFFPLRGIWAASAADRVDLTMQSADLWRGATADRQPLSAL